MKGKLASETTDESGETENDHATRRRVLKASAALAATGIVDTAAAKHNPVDCPRTVQCNGTAEFVFNDQTVGDDTVELTETSLVEDEVIVEKASLPCGGFIDLHDPTRKSGPSGTFGAGYPVGATPFLKSGTTYTHLPIELFEGEGQFGTCIDWNNEVWPTDGNPNGTRPMTATMHMDTNGNQEFDHYCDHITAGQGKDHAYLCNYNQMSLGPGTLELILRSATVIGDGGCGGFSQGQYNVGVWVTQDQFSATGCDVRDRVVTYLENSDGNTPLNVNAIGKTELPDPDEECPQTTFEDTKPCDPLGNEVMWDDFYQWWRKYVDCKDITAEPDCNLLVSRCTDPPCGSGLGGGTLAVANGNNIENLPSSYSLFDDSCGAYSMGITIQEVGHCLITGVSDDDGDGHAEHDTCDDRTHGGDIYTTPMGVGYHDELTDDNECGDSDGGTVTDPTGAKYVHFEYDDCAGSHMT